MKRIKQEQHIEIEEKSQQLKFRMQTEIQINKHHALCQASDQLEELDYTKLYFAYSGIRKSPDGSFQCSIVDSVDSFLRSRAVLRVQNLVHDLLAVRKIGSGKEVH